MVDDRTPVFILTGPASRAELLDRWLPAPALNGTVVLRNAEASGPMAGGCFCCAGQGDLIRSLRDLLPRARRGEVTRVVIDAADHADPAKIAEAIQADIAAAAVYRLGGIIAFADGMAGFGDWPVTGVDRIVIAGELSDAMRHIVHKTDTKTHYLSGPFDPKLIFPEFPGRRLRRQVVPSQSQG
jgi:hypothetical protein